jgi:hypothetical protein
MERREDFIISEEIVEWIGLKKSEYLSKIVSLQLSDDIGFEEFHHFDSFIPNTIESPDKVFENPEDDQRVRTYLKSYTEKSGFHQMVIGVLLDDKQNNADVFVPIISFVSKKSNLIKEFSVGRLISRPTLN